MSPCEIRPADFNLGSHLPSVPAFVTTECPRSPPPSRHAPTPHSRRTPLPENERTHLILPAFSKSPLTRSAMVWNDARPAAGLAATARHVHHAPHSPACKHTFFLSLALKRDRQPGVDPRHVGPVVSIERRYRACTLVSTLALYEESHGRDP